MVNNNIENSWHSFYTNGLGVKYIAYGKKNYVPGTATDKNIGENKRC